MVWTLHIVTQNFEQRALQRMSYILTGKLMKFLTDIIDREQ